jgi:spore coat polysaccharide biosynthesis predicted glycosyltransferase SpsG
MDLAVAAAGVMTCEMAAVGVPLVVVTGEDKELETAAMLEAAGAAHMVGRWGPLAGDAVADAVARLANDLAHRLALSGAARRAVDGHGLRRLVDLIAEGIKP